jgi:hypothetical protein
MPLFQIMQWEHEELLEHLDSRPDIWQRNAQNTNLWVRLESSFSELSEKKPEAAAAVHFLPPPADGPFTPVGVDLYPLTWDIETTRIYFEDLLRAWSAYGHRKKVEEILRTFGTAEPDLASIAVEAYDWVERPKEPEAPAASPLLPTMSAEVHPETLCGPPPPDMLDLGLWRLEGNVGWLRLRLQGGMIRVTASIRSGENGWSEALEGFVRPRSGRIEDTALRLSGLAERKTSLEVRLSSQLELKETQENDDA